MDVPLVRSDFDTIGPKITLLIISLEEPSSRFLNSVLYFSFFKKEKAHTFHFKKYLLSEESVQQQLVDTLDSLRSTHL